MYIVEPGESTKIEANPDAIGLKIGIVYHTERERNELYFHRFTCHNDSVLTIQFIEGENISYAGGTASTTILFNNNITKFYS